MKKKKDDSTFFDDASDTLQGCADHLADDLGPEESAARRRLVQLCKDIAFDWDNHVKQDVEG